MSELYRDYLRKNTWCAYFIGHWDTCLEDIVHSNSYGCTIIGNIIAQEINDFYKGK